MHLGRETGGLPCCPKAHGASTHTPLPSTAHSCLLVSGGGFPARGEFGSPVSGSLQAIWGAPEQSPRR